MLGPLQWTPTLQLREAGLDSNVFNTPKDAKQDMTASFVPFVDSLLTLGIAQVATQGTAEYAYFQRYTNQRAINGRVSSRIVFPLSRIQPVATLSWAHVKERPTSEIDVRAPRTDLGYGGGLTTKLTSRLALNAIIDRQDTRYDSGEFFRGADLASQLNRQTTGITTGIRMAASPLTSFFVDGGASRDEFVLQRDRNTENVRGDLGFEFAPDAVIAGPRDGRLSQDAAATRLWSARRRARIRRADIVGRFDLHAARTHALHSRASRATRRIPSARRSRTICRPPSASRFCRRSSGRSTSWCAAAAKSWPTRRPRLAAARTDRADTLGGGLSIRISTQGRIGLNYDDTKRRSDAGAEFGYARRRIYTTVTYGF